MKAYLKGNDQTLYTLAPKVTTIGKEGCDIVLQSAGIDPQHAVIEYNEQEDSYVLQDLNTAQGTYVNDCRVQNASVRLAPGDVIRLGYSGTTFNLEIENPPPGKNSFLHQIAYPPVQQRPAWTQPITLLTDSMCQQQQQQQQHMMSRPLPYLATGTTTITIPSAVWSPSQQQQQFPRPPIRSRPLSAGSASGSRRPPVVFDRVHTYSGSGVNSPAISQRGTSGGWVNGIDRQQPQVSMTNGIDIPRLQEKEQKIMQLQEEVNRLKTLETECYRKDTLVQHLQHQISELQQRMTEQGPLIMGQEVDVTQRLVHLENELTLKKQEIRDLTEQLTCTKVSTEQPITSSPIPVVTDELSQKTKELNNVKNELERVRKDKGITSGLVTQMQRDMSSKDSTISRLTREIETLKKELRERESQISTMSAKVTRLRDSNKSTEERDAREKELISLRQKFKTTENKMNEQQDLISSLKEELEKAKINLFEEKQAQKKFQTDLDISKAELQDVQRAERVVRVDLEQATKRLERFRNRVIQVTYSTPGIKSPETVIDDDELIGTLKSVIEERTSFFQQIKELEDKLKTTDTASSSFKKSVDELRNHIQSISTHLKSNGYLVSSIKQEVELLQSVTTVDSLMWVRDTLVDLLNSALDWEQQIETSLDKCGVNVKHSNDAPGRHITMLYSKWETSLGEKERLLKQIAQIEEKYKAELEQTSQIQRQDADNRITDAVEKTRLEAEEKLNRALEEVRAVETERRENEVEAERKKTEELELRLVELRENYTELQNSSRIKTEEMAAMATRMEEKAEMEAGLQQEYEKLAKEKEEFSSRLEAEQKERDRKSEEDLQAYREQNKQHSITISMMEEKVVKITKKNKEYQEEIANLKKSLHELKLAMTELKNKPAPKPVPPPKPKVIVQKNTEDLAAMENLIVILRKESMELKTKIQDQEDVILGLRRDLAGAHARLSDMTGELSETQKRENEKNKELLLQRERELTDVRQQLAKLSKIIDKQKDEIKTLQGDLSKEKAISIKYHSHLEDHVSKIQSLESALKQEQDEQKKQLALLDQEGRITSEMTALGAQCRGERHEQVIMRQREALAELRARIKTLEQSKPPLPSTQDHALQQVIMLKKELAEMRANQALSEDKVALGTLDREVSRARGLLNNVNPEADMERSAHRETMDALDASENSYLTLLRAMASCLELESIEGLRPIGHIPKDERDRLLMERENSCQLLANRIKVFRERISRKDELLQGYERDLVKMRQSQELADKKAIQVENLATDVKTKAEETQYLRESLNRTRDRLDQEKRLNSAIKQRKTFHLENERMHIQNNKQSSQPHCKIPDPLGRDAARRKAAKETMKRKNYEIKTLKSELSGKEQSLFDTEYRLATLENSMGLNRSAEVVES